MRKVVTAAEMREIDRLMTERFATPSLLLMESAARAAAQEIIALFPEGVRRKPVLVLCGRGNNGGDGAAVARMLKRAGAFVALVLFGRVEETKGDARVNFEIARAMALPRGDTQGDRHHDHTSIFPRFSPDGWLTFSERPTLEECETLLYGGEDEQLQLPPEVIVDALFGTGLTRPLAGLHAEVVSYIERTRDSPEGEPPVTVVSLDLPSGLDADRGEPIGPAVSADLTVTFTAPKPANALPPASLRGGRLVVADIGSPQTLIDESPSRLYLTERRDTVAWLRRTRYAPDSYKNTHGHALVVAGSRDMTGAAVLCADAAMRAGAGLVTAATSTSALPSVAARLMPEVMTAALAETGAGSVSFEAYEQFERLRERATVVAVGCGLSRGDESTRRFVRELVARRTTPVVIDADGLNALAPWPTDLRGTPAAPLVLTPHEGELGRLLGTNDRGPRPSSPPPTV